MGIGIRGSVHKVLWVVTMIFVLTQWGGELLNGLLLEWHDLTYFLRGFPWVEKREREACWKTTEVSWVRDNDDSHHDAISGCVRSKFSTGTDDKMCWSIRYLCETKWGVKGNPRFFMSNFKDGVSINKDVEGYESKIWWGKIRSSVLDLLSLKWLLPIQVECQTKIWVWNFMDSPNTDFSAEMWKQDAT